MQAAILSHGRIGRENSCFYGRAITVDAPAIKRNAADVFQIEINCIGCNRVQKAIERLLQREFEFSYYTYDFVNSRPVQQTAWSMDQQRNVFVKLDIRRQYHFVHSIDLHSCHSVSLDGLAIELRAEPERIRAGTFAVFLGSAYKTLVQYVRVAERTAEARQSPNLQ